MRAPVTFIDAEQEANGCGIVMHHRLHGCLHDARLMESNILPARTLSYFSLLCKDDVCCLAASSKLNIRPQCSKQRLQGIWELFRPKSQIIYRPPVLHVC